MRIHLFSASPYYTCVSIVFVFVDIQEEFSYSGKHLGQLLSDILTSEGHEVEVASNGSQGIEMFKKKSFDLSLIHI